MLDSETRVLTEELLEWFPLMGGELSRRTMTGPRSCRSNSRRNTQTSSCAMLS